MTLSTVQETKKIIWSKSLEILDKFISRAENNEFNITNKLNPKIFASTIIYTVLVSNDNIPNVNISEISGLPNYSISRCYINYFRDLYLNENFNFPPYYGFSRIRDIISLCFFELIKNTEIKTSKLVSLMKTNILETVNLPNKLSQKDVDILQNLLANHQDKLTKYLTDLAETLKQILGSSILHRKIETVLVVKPIAKHLYSKEINLFQSFKLFYRSVREIHDLLKRNFPKIFIYPIRYKSKKGNFKKVIGSRIKLYIIKHIYNGLYYRVKKGKCPECEKEGFKVNTDISRLKALEFHHTTAEEKETKYSSEILYEMFNNNRANPHFLEDLIKLMESKKIILVCANHHDLISYKYYNYFKHLISWTDLPKVLPQDIFSLTPELIHTLIRIAINNHSETNNLSYKRKSAIKLSIISNLKKRYIIETIYGIYCHVCEEFNTREHLIAFHFNHNNEDTKTLLASDLYKNESITCSEIVQNLEQEEGGYICSNCHAVWHNNTLINIFDQIYDDMSVVKKTTNDYYHVREKFTLIYNDVSIRNPLKLSKRISDKFESHLIAIYEISKLSNIITNKSIASYLGLSSKKLVHSFFTRNNYMRPFVNIDKSKKIHMYSLTKKGVEAVSLMNYFKKYYKNQAI